MMLFVVCCLIQILRLLCFLYGILLPLPIHQCCQTTFTWRHEMLQSKEPTPQTITQSYIREHCVSAGGYRMCNRGVAPVGDVSVLTPTLFPVRGFNTRTFFRFSAVLHKRLTAVALRFSGRSVSASSPLPSPPSQTWHRLWVWPADDWLFCLKSRLSSCVIYRSARAEEAGTYGYGYQCWEGYFGNVIGYRLQVTIFKM